MFWLVIYIRINQYGDRIQLNSGDMRNTRAIASSFETICFRDFFWSYDDHKIFQFYAELTTSSSEIELVHQGHLVLMASDGSKVWETKPKVLLVIRAERMQLKGGHNTTNQQPTRIPERLELGSRNLSRYSSHDPHVV
jgi:hypothetical protein